MTGKITPVESEDEGCEGYEGKEEVSEDEEEEPEGEEVGFEGEEVGCEGKEEGYVTPVEMGSSYRRESR